MHEGNRGKEIVETSKDFPRQKAMLKAFSAVVFYREKELPKVVNTLLALANSVVLNNWLL